MERPRNESPSTSAKDTPAADQQSSDQSTEQEKDVASSNGKSDTVLGNLNKGPEKPSRKDSAESRDSGQGVNKLDHDDGSVLGNINEDGRDRKE